MPIPQEIAEKYLLLWERAFDKIGLSPPDPPAYEAPLPSPSTQPDLFRMVVHLCEQVMTRFIKRVQAVSKNSPIAGDDTEIDKLKHHVIEEMRKLEHLQLTDASTPWTEKFGLVLTQFMFKIDTLEERFNTSLSLVED